MWLRLFLVPIVGLFSIAAMFARAIGQILPAASLHRWLFDRIVGGSEVACKVRDELVASAEDYLIESESGGETDESSEEIRTEIESSRNRASKIISNGEFVLALLFGIAGFYVSAWSTFWISVIVAFSASLRITAVDTLAITSPDANRSVEWLIAARAWNKGPIENGRMLLNAALAVWVYEFDERAFEAYVEEVFVPTLDGGRLSYKQAYNRLFPRVFGIIKKKYGMAPEAA